MTQLMLETKRTKNIKKLLVQLATRQLDWREEKIKEIITSQKYGLNISASLRIDFAKNNKELPLVKSPNNSAKNIPVKTHSKLSKLPLNSSKIFHNGDYLHVKTCKTQKSNAKRTIFNSIVITQDENEPLKQQKQVFLPKINVDLRKKTSLELFKSSTQDRQRGFDSQQLQIIQQEEPSVLKKEKENKFQLKESY